MKLKKIIPIFILILLGNLYNIQAADSSQSLSLEHLPADMIGEILKNMANPKSINDITQADIEQIKNMALIRKDNPNEKTNFKEKVKEALNNLKQSTCEYLKYLLNYPDEDIRDPKHVIREAMHLNTEFSQLCLKELINKHPEIAKDIKIVFSRTLGIYTLGNPYNLPNNSMMLKKLKFLIQIGSKQALNGLKFLIAFKPNIEINKGKPLLIEAIDENLYNIVDFLLKAGANPDVKDENGYTALMRASNDGQKELVELLLKSGANPSIKNNDGKNAYKLALDNGYENIAELLIKHLFNNLKIQK